MLILILIFVVMFTRFRSLIDSFYFEPAGKRNIENFNNSNPPYPCINVRGHYALRRRGTNSKKVMIVAHGNAGSFLDRNHVFTKLNNYSGDIYLFEYPGFSGLDGKTNIANCVNELMFWIKYLRPKYDKLDLFGESIGGGIIIEACSKNSLSTINKIYLQSTFTSMGDVIYDINYGLYLLYKSFLLDDLNTNKSLSKVFCNKFVIIHSKEDKLINYNQALKNFQTLKELNKQVEFIDGQGLHGNTIFELKAKNKK